MGFEVTRNVDSWIIRLSDPETQEQALGELRKILMYGLRRVFGDRGGGEPFCEDVAQDTLIQVLEKRHQFSGRSRFTKWAMSIAVRIGTEHFRRRKARDVSFSSVFDSSQAEPGWEDTSCVAPEVQEARQALAGSLRQLIKTTLTQRQREATEAVMCGTSVDEIAVKFRSNRNAVYKLMHEARGRLRSGLIKAGYTANDVRSTFA